MSAIRHIARGIDRINHAIGSVVAWIALAMVLAQFLVVLLRYVFGLGLLELQESIIYMHGLLFMLGSGYALMRDAHVRVDVFYRRASERAKSWVNLCGVLLLLWPLCAMIFYVAWPYVGAAWAVREGSREASGIPGIYLLKTVILVFAALMFAQGLSLALRSVLVLAGRESLPEPARESS